MMEPRLPKMRKKIACQFTPKRLHEELNSFCCLRVALLLRCRCPYPVSLSDFTYKCKAKCNDSYLHVLHGY